MKKCFICGREYDEKNRINAVDVINKFSKEVLPVNRVVIGEQVFQLCHYCVKAMTIGVLSFHRNERIYQLHNVELIYEEGDDIDAEPEGDGAGLDVAQEQDG